MTHDHVDRATGSPMSLRSQCQCQIVCLQGVPIGSRTAHIVLLNNLVLTTFCTVSMPGYAH